MNKETLKIPHTLQYGVKFPTRVFAGEGSVRKLSDIVAQGNHQHIIVLTDRTLEKQGLLGDICEILRASALSYNIIADVPPEPSEDDAKKICAAALSYPCDLLVAVGGGSVLDIAKLVALAYTNPSFPEDFQRPELTTQPPLPTAALPTTSGTGAEATANSILLYPKQDLKIGIVSDHFLYSSVILDPTLTYSLPPALTASTGIDALCHAIESYLSTLNNPINEFFAFKAVGLLSDNILTAYNDGYNTSARAAMQLGSFFAGVCLTSSSTVAVHALSYPLGGKYHIPHGISNAILLPYVIEEMLEDIRPQLTVLSEYLLPDTSAIPPSNRPEAVLDYLFCLTDTLGIPKNLVDYNVSPDDLDYLTKNALGVTRLLSRNPKVFGSEEIQRIYKKIL